MKKIRLITVAQFGQEYPWPSESAMRSYIYRAKSMDIQDAFVKVGKRVLIDPDKFFILIKKFAETQKKEKKNEQVDIQPQE